ncbi:zinc ribbon domain-containing protein, partial [Schinkia azotoformans]|nr:zinc ribbon domain-containing protein [Schinkia azotoformans]
SKEPIQELIIIDKDKWNRVQAIREKRSPSNIIDKENPCIIKTTKGKLLLVGMTRCGHCGSPLTTTYHKKSYTVSPK